MQLKSLKITVSSALLLSLITGLTGATACNNGGAKKDETTAAPAPARPATSANAADEIPALNMASAPPAPQAIPAPPDVAAAPADAKKTASGLATKVITPGTGKDHPAATDKVKVNYTGWTTDGKMFDSSVSHGEPATFGVSDVIPGWTEGLQLMVAGEKRRFWIPSTLAYGPRGMPGIAPNSALTFDVELLEITQAPKPPPVPTDVAAAPASATKTASGLAYRILTPTKDANAQKPGPTSVVSVNYSGWTTDGKMFDSSITQGHPVTFPLNRVIKGWTEGLQLMKVGDKARFWIPGALAYDDPSRPARPGVPHGTLVFDVELLEIRTPPPGMGMPMAPPPGSAQAH